MITVNVLGAGRWGPNITRCFTNLSDAKVHYVCDPDQGRLDWVSTRIGGIETTTDVLLAINDPSADAIVIATPVDTHYDLTRQALAAGKHVLVEKPLCKEIAQCEELVETANDRGLTLAVGHIFLFNGGIRKVREYIQSGELGRIQYIHALRTNLGPVRTDVNALWDLASHDLSIFNYWLEENPRAVSATGQRCLNADVEDVVNATYEYGRGVTASTFVSWLNPKKVREITIVGDKKMVVWDDMNPLEPVRVYDKSIDIDAKGAYTHSFSSFQAAIRDGDVLIPRVLGGEPLMAECEHFVECIREGTVPLNNAEEASRIVAALIAGNESIADAGSQRFVKLILAGESMLPVCV